MSFDANHLIATATVAAAIAAGGSVWAAFKANSTSNSIAKIERERRHQELRPQFTAWCEEYSDSFFYLNLRLDGPDGLDQLDSFRISISNNKNFHPTSLVVQAKNADGRPTDQDIEQHIWAPFRFSPSVTSSTDDHRATEDGRSISYPVLKLGDEARFQMERTRAPDWNSALGEKWWKSFAIKPTLRISIECHRSELDPWVVPFRLATPLEKENQIVEGQVIEAEGTE